MINKSFIKENAIAFIILIVVVFAFSLPAIQGKKLNSHDFASWEYMCHGVSKEFEKTKESVYWSNNQFGGMPSITFSNGDSGNLITSYIFNFIYDVLPRPLGMFLAAIISFFILVTAFKWRPVTKVLATIGFALTSYNPILAMAGHDSKFLSICLTAGMIAGIVHIINNRRWLGIAIFALFTNLLFSSGHYQIIYYSLIIVGIMAIFIFIDAYKKGEIKMAIQNTVLMLLLTILAVAPCMPNIIMTKNYTKSTMRGAKPELTITKKQKSKDGGLDRDYAFSWSNGVGETFALMIPGLYGPFGQKASIYAEGATAETLSSMGVPGQNADQITHQLPDYWGPQPFISGPIYFGSIIVFLFILSLFIVRSYHKYWIVAACILMALLSYGKNFATFNNFIFDYLPMYNKFRTPSMSLLMCQLFFPFIGGWAINDMITGKVSKVDMLKALKYAGGISLGIVVVVGLGSNIFQNFKGANDDQLISQFTQMFSGDGSKANQLFSSIKKDREHFVMLDSIRSIIFIALAIGLIWAFIKEKIKANILVIILAVLVYIDLFAIDKRYVPDEVYVDKDEYEAQYFTPRAVDTKILQDTEPFYRVQDFTVNTYNDAKPSYFHNMVGGYSPAKMEIYQDLIDVQLSKNNKEVYNMLNTKYFIVGEPGKENVMPNPERNGNAWFVNNIKLVKNADEEMLSLNAPSLSDSSIKGDFKSKETAVVREKNKNLIPVTTFVKDTASVIKLTNYSLNKLEYNSSNKQNGFGVFSDIYIAEGLTATIDDKPVEIIRTNYVLRGLNIPAGNHKINFSYEPVNTKKYKAVSNVLSVLLFGLICFALFKYYKSDSKTEIK